MDQTENEMVHLALYCHFSGYKDNDQAQRYGFNLNFILFGCTFTTKGSANFYTYPSLVTRITFYEFNNIEVIHKFCTKEDAMASGWDKIPSIPNLEVDWGYEPENTLGNRLWKRLQRRDLRRILGVKETPVKMVTADSEMRGRLVDVSQKGLGVLVDRGLERGATGKVGFHLGKETIVAKAVMKNSVRQAGNHRIGMEFVDLSGSMEDYIVHLVSSESYGQV